MLILQTHPLTAQNPFDMLIAEQRSRKLGDSMRCSGGNMVLGYCFRCQARVEPNSLSDSTLTNGKYIKQGICPVCGSTVHIPKDTQGTKYDSASQSKIESLSLTQRPKL
ncbi:DUF5679 domain-containing protein [Chloroflexota bacterium]